MIAVPHWTTVAPANHLAYGRTPVAKAADPMLPGCDPYIESLIRAAERERERTEAPRPRWSLERSERLLAV